MFEPTFFYSVVCSHMLPPSDVIDIARYRTVVSVYINNNNRTFKQVHISDSAPELVPLYTN